MVAACRLRTARRASGIVRCAAAAFGIVVALVLATLPALAQSYACNDLAAKLATLDRRAASSASSPADKWAAAIVEQKQAIASNSASQRRCGDLRDPRCAAIYERGRQMAANLVNLERQHARMGGGTRSGVSNEQARIRSLMASLHCGEKRDRGTQPIVATFDGSRSRVTINGAAPGEAGVTYRIARPGEAPAEPRPPRRENRGLFGFLFGGADDAAGDPPPGEEQVIDPSTAQMLSGSYRTLCVRTCDGYYFPISFHASQGRLRTDANVCSALCPAAETRLYYHSNPGQEAEQAIAADGSGEPLTKLPNAFRYRSEVVAGCTCGKPDLRLLPPGAGGLKGNREVELNDRELPLPRVRPNPDEDPETQAVAAVGLTVEPVSPPPQTDAVADASKAVEEAAPTQVRIVGPKYFSDR
jgi:hypothetical protein